MVDQSDVPQLVLRVIDKPKIFYIYWNWLTDRLERLRLLVGTGTGYGTLEGSLHRL